MAGFLWLSSVNLLPGSLGVRLRQGTEALVDLFL